MKIAVIDYGAGNTRSVEFALNRIGCDALLTKRPDELQNADGVVFPGVGHASHAMESLNENGLVEVIKNLRQPVLGVCLGMQLLCNQTEEGDARGLGILDVKVKKIESQLPVPHVGWNQVAHNGAGLFEGIPNNAYFYFVHSYFVPSCGDTIGYADYELTFSAAFQVDNFYACQFHPEKSGTAGERVLKNFIELCE